MREALALTETDSTLKQWFDEQAELSAALSAKLGEIPVPNDLRAKILAGADVSSAPGNVSVSKFRRWLPALATAACLVVTGIAIFLWQNRYVPSRRFRLRCL